MRAASAFWLLFFLAVLPSFGQVEALLSRVDAEVLRTFHTNLFVNPGQSRGFTRRLDPAIPRRPAGQHDEARDYIFRQFQEMGWPVKLIPFSFTTRFGNSPTVYQYTLCHNVVAALPGIDPATHGIYIVSAFYDTIDRGQPLPINLSSGPAPRSPGADLNASGVAGLLAVARALSRERFMATLVLAAFDASEKNFGGSYHFVRTRTTWNPAKTNKLYRGSIRGMISLDTIGYNPSGSTYNMASLWGGPATPTPLRKRLARALRLYGGIQTVHSGSIGCSDHVPFWEAGMDACVLSERNIWNNPYTYTEMDSIAKAHYLDYAYMARMARGVTAFLAQAAVPAKRLTLSAAGNGIVLGADGFHAVGTVVPLQAFPSPGWRLAGWAGDLAGCTGTNLTLNVPMTMDRSVEARFLPLEPEGLDQGL